MVSLPSGWEYSKFGICICDNGWSGISCGSEVYAKRIDSANVGKIEYEFNVGTLSHHYEMKYDGITYTTPIIPEKKYLNMLQ